MGRIGNICFALGQQITTPNIPLGITVSCTLSARSVAFKNPRDQIGPAILTRQMYPSHPKKFMIKYTEATK